MLIKLEFKQIQSHTLNMFKTCDFPKDRTTCFQVLHFLDPRHMIIQGTQKEYILSHNLERKLQFLFIY